MEAKFAIPEEPTIENIHQMLLNYCDFMVSPEPVKAQYPDYESKMVTIMRAMVDQIDDLYVKELVQNVITCYDMMALIMGDAIANSANKAADYAKKSIVEMLHLIRAIYPFAPVDLDRADRNLEEIGKIYKSIYKRGDNLYLGLDVCLVGTSAFNCIIIENYISEKREDRSLLKEKMNFVVHHLNVYTPVLYNDTNYNGDVDIKTLCELGYILPEELLPETHIFSFTNGRLSGFRYLMTEIEEFARDIGKLSGDALVLRTEQFNTIRTNYDWVKIAKDAVEPRPSGPSQDFGILTFMIKNKMEWFYTMLATRPYSTLTDDDLDAMANSLITDAVPV
jgi:hypothetical protein